jgi:hypothetical protein
MPPDLFPPIVGGLTDGLVGGILGFCAAYYAYVVQKKNKILEYNITSIPFTLWHNPSSKSIKVIVDKNLITGNDEDSGEIVEVSNALVYFVSISNVGNAHIGKFSLEIKLDVSEKILSWDTEPESRPGYEIIHSENNSSTHILNISIPFINIGDKLSIRLVSAGDKQNCDVYVFAPEVKLRPLNLSRETIMTGAKMIVYAFLLVPVVYSGFLVPGFIAKSLGGKATRTTIYSYSYPGWLKILLFALFILVLVKLFFTVHRFFKLYRLM